MSVFPPGVEGGLRLLLNVEQYEYMPGPNSAAGLKLSLHNQHEFASVKDHGLVVPPGSHALVGIRVTEVHSTYKLLKIEGRYANQ